MRQHYVPQFLLANFDDGATKEPRVRVYDLPSSRTFVMPVASAASRRNYYDTSSGERGSAEAALGALEDDAAPIVAKVIADERLVLSGRPRSVLAMFVAALAVRGPTTRGVMTGISRKVRETLSARGEEISPELGEQLRDPSDEEVRESHARHISFIARESYLDIAARHWRLVAPPLGRAWVTSDAPVVVRARSSIDGSSLRSGLLGRDAEIFVPLSPHFLLLIAHAVGGETAEHVLHHASERMWEHANFKIVLDAHSQLYARSDAHFVIPSRATNARTKDRLTVEE